MRRKVILITGAAGFLGSAVTVALSRDHEIVAVDIRLPCAALRVAAPNVKWQRLDIADSFEVATAFQCAKKDCGRIDIVLHFAAFYHFGADWLPEYERTNIRGTANIVQAAIDTGVQRIIFSSSIAAMEPPPAGHRLTEMTPTSDFIPYAKSKSIAEGIILQGTGKLPGIVLRLGGVYSDWCELPPLYSLIKMWSAREPFCRIIPGRGESGIPYIHHSDVVLLIKRCIEIHERLDQGEIFLVSQPGAVLHKDLFSIIQKTLKRESVKPIYIAPGLARLGLSLKLAFTALARESPYEQPWMLAFIDRPWVVDTGSMQKKLGWNCSPGMGVLDRLAIILRHYTEEPYTWLERNKRRNNGDYIYY